MPDKTIFIPFTQTDTLSSRAKRTQNQSAASPPSEFGCSLSTLNESGADQLYYYQAFYIRFPKNVIDEAAGKVTRRAFTLRSNRAEDRTPEFLNRDGVVRYLTCRIPDARQAVTILEKEMQKFGAKSWYNDLDPPENAKVKSGSGYNSMSGDYVYTCQYEPGDGYGNTSSTITIDGVTYTTYYFQEECGYEYVEDGGDEGPETPTEDPFGGGGGGIGDPGDTNEDPNPCSGIGDGTQYPMTSDGEIIGCGSEEAIKAEQLKNLLEENEFALLEGPCDEIDAYRVLAEYTPPQSVMDKLNYLEDNFLGTFGDFDLLSIEDANGTVVNMDEFSVNVANLPSGMTANELLNEIRININDFINTDYSEFSPYNEFVNYPYNETEVWNSDDPLGAIIHIGIPNDSAIFGDDGSVIVSNYNSNSWTFSTISAPYDWDHPVSGNREFGFTLNGDGSYTFYTKGVDRFTQDLFGETVADALSDDPFSKADNLWESFQQGIKEYVNQNGGSASVNDPQYKRPDWNKLQNFFNDQANIQTIGCD